MSLIAVFDIDGCISDDRNRRPWLEKGNYDEYHGWCHTDKPANREVLEKENRAFQIYFVTGRPESYRKRTELWLADHFPGLHLSYNLLMRPDDNTMPSPDLKVWLLERERIKPDNVAIAYDDRADVLDAYREWGIEITQLLMVGEGGNKTAAILHRMATTFEERNAQYRDNYKVVGNVMRNLHGRNSVHPAAELVDDFDLWHLYELLIVKLTRFANSGLKHRDSIHDIAVYAAMIENILEERNV